MTDRGPLTAIDAREVREALGGISVQTLRRLIQARKFPRPFLISSQGKVWFRADVEWYLWGRQIRERMQPKSRDQRKPTPDQRRPS